MQVEYLQQTYQVSVGRACRLVNLARSLYYYQGQKKDDLVIEKLQQMVDKRPMEGFWKIHLPLRKEGLGWNHKRVYRIYKLLNFDKKRKGKPPPRTAQPLEALEQINLCWSMPACRQTGTL